MIGIGVAGYGYWGPNVVRNFNELTDAHVVSVCELDDERLSAVQSRYPGINTTRDYNDLLHDPRVDAIAIVTPVSTHFPLALEALRAGKHVLVEKPLAATVEQGLRLIEEANHRDRVLLVDHTFVYTGAVRKMRQLIATDGLGELYYYDSVRINLGLFQHDVNVMWDLGVHDLSIMDYVLGLKPVGVSATGMSHIPGEPHNIAHMTLFFETSLIAHLHVNWLAPVKVRRTLIGGSRKMIAYDDLEPSEKVKVYDRGITLNDSTESVYKLLVSYRTGDMWAPQVDLTEALRTEAIHFLRCIDGAETPITDGQAGVRVLRVLEAAAASMAERGRLVELDRVGAAP